MRDPSIDDLCGSDAAPHAECCRANRGRERRRQISGFGERERFGRRELVDELLRLSVDDAAVRIEEQDARCFGRFRDCTRDVINRKLDIIPV